MGARLIGMKNPSSKMEIIQKQTDISGTTLLHKLRNNADKELKRGTPVDTGKMMKSWKKTPVVSQGKTKTTSVYNTATNPRTGYLYPLALEYGFHHYAWGKYIGFHAGIFFRERTVWDSKAKLVYYIPELQRTVLRRWH